MGCGMFSCSRNALISLNIVYMLVAVLLIGVAAYAKAMSILTSLAIVGGIIGCGVFLLIIGCMGFFGAVKHHQICLFFYMVILFLLFLIQFSLAIALLAINDNTRRILAEEAWDRSSHDIKLDFMSRADCCGFNQWNITDNDPLCTATSCCSDASEQHTACCGDDGTMIICKSYDQTCKSCSDKVREYGSLFRITGGVCLFISFTEIMGVIITVRYRNQRNFATNNDFL